MKFDKIEIEVPAMEIEEWEQMPKDQQNRIQELKRKLAQYRSMLFTFRKKYTKDKYYHFRNKEGRIKRK